MNLICRFWKHRWVFKGGHWVIPEVAALTKRECSRCGLFQEISQDHVNGLQFLEIEQRPNGPSRSRS